MDTIEKLLARSSFDQWEIVLKRQFSLRPAEALKKLALATFSEEDLYSDRSLRDYAAKIFRWSAAYGETSTLQQLLRVYNTLDPKLKVMCMEPSVSDTKADWLNKAESRR